MNGWETLHLINSKWGFSRGTEDTLTEEGSRYNLSRYNLITFVSLLLGPLTSHDLKNTEQVHLPKKL